MEHQQQHEDEQDDREHRQDDGDRSAAHARFTDNVWIRTITVMALASNLMTIQDAARVLGVSDRHVNRLLDSGELVRVARGLVDRHSVENYRSQARGGRKRVWTERTAWAAIALLSGEHPSWLGQVQVSRLRAVLRVATVEDLVVRCRDRADVRVYTGHSSAASRLASAVAHADTARLGLVGVNTNVATTVDGYLPADRLDTVVRQYALREDPAGRYVLRVTGFDFAILTRLAVAGKVLAALDAATSTDPRVRGMGESAIEDALMRFRGE
jgi:excisionase family DNA binding protein